jgi:hypothetical protein
MSRLLPRQEIFAMSQFDDFGHTATRSSGAHEGGVGYGDASVIDVDPSSATIRGEPGRNVVVFGSTSQIGTVIDVFTVRSDSINFVGHGDAWPLSVHDFAGDAPVVDGTVQPQAAIVAMGQSSATASALADADMFVFAATSHGGDAINGVTGDGELLVHGLAGHSLSYTLVPDIDGLAGDARIAGDGHVLLTLETVLPSALTIHPDYIS